VDDPQAYAGESFRAILKERGVRVRRPARRGRAPAAARLLGFVESEPMNVLVHALGKNSDNFVAEALLKTIAAEHRAGEAGGGMAPDAPATWKDGIAAVEHFLGEEIGLPAGSFRYGNGSGLFDATAISPAQIVAVLVAAHQSMRYGPDLMASLSIAGVDGTLRRRMAGTPAEQHVRAKTGTLATVIALSGYAAVDARRPVAFSIIINDLTATWAAREQARSLQDRIADVLVAYMASPRPAP
jgi:D-alanyl-D-alanine carboxypeptidase/D-alanyl-D-alanine-endopeptidase (penicillin-binding protein 4)